MKGNSGPPVAPHYTGDLSTGIVTGGINFDIFSTIADLYSVSYMVTFSTVWIMMNEDGTLGGTVGDVGYVIIGLMYAGTVFY